MLAAAARLRRRSEFAAAVRVGRRAASGKLVIHLVIPAQPVGTSPTGQGVVGVPDRPVGAEGAPGTAVAGTRVGFVVPRSVGGAVVRNRVRRRLRHLVAARLATLPPGSRMVVRALPGAAERSFADLGTDLDSAITAARRPRTRRRAT